MGRTPADPLTEARTYLLCRDGAAVVFDPRPEALDELLLLLELHDAHPFAVLETAAWADGDMLSPGYRLARLRNWFWAGPVQAWETEGTVLRLLDRLLLELDPDARDEDCAKGRCMTHVELDLAPFQVLVEPVAGEPGYVRYRVDGHDLPASDWLAHGVELMRAGEMA